MKKINIGGDRLGSGNKMNVALRNYERSTHDLSYLWRSSMAPGTLVPFLKQVALPGDTFDINLDAMVKTIPTLGPLFGSFKFQLDVFQIPMRLYIKELHNNKLGIGLDMSKVAFPTTKVTAKNPVHYLSDTPDADLSTFQVNQSSLMAYMGVRAIGYHDIKEEKVVERNINAIPFIAYYDIYKNYYANKQEENGYAITSKFESINPWETVTIYPQNSEVLNSPTPFPVPIKLKDVNYILLKSTIPISHDYHSVDIIGDTIELSVDNNGDGNFVQKALDELYDDFEWLDNYTLKVSNLKTAYENTEFEGIAHKGNSISIPIGIGINDFPLSDIDNLRELLLSQSSPVLNNSPMTLFNYWDGANNVCQYSQAGLAIKTYQSDIFNNWISTEWLDGENGINAITAVDTSDGSFSIDQLNLSKKVYDMLNRIAVSGGTYQDWLEVSYDIDTYFKAESPIYCGGLSKEIVFNEVISTAENDENPLGTLAGKGNFSDKHKGGYVVVKVDEPSYIIGIASITPRIDYSQGNDWDISLHNMGELHVPALDGIGFQDLLAEQLHGIVWNQFSKSSPAIGKQPAWINYMTNYNRVFGTFAEPDNQMFMTLNRRYTTEFIDAGTGPDGPVYEISIVDPTTYIDPTKYNYAFADTAIDAQNFWIQIGVQIEARRKMSAKQIPNL